MRVSTLSVLSALAVVGCQADPGTAPRFIRESRTFVGAPLACNFTALRLDAAQFFSSPTDAVFGIISDLQALWVPGGTPAGDGAAFNGMARLAVARGTSAQSGTGADGEAVIKGFIGCTSISALPADLDSLDVAIDKGALEVRAGGHDSAVPVLAYVASPGQRSIVLPVWGAEASDWQATLGQRTLLFGYERPVSTFTMEPPVSDNGVPFTGFELSSFPSGLTFPAAAPLITGICIDQFRFGFSRLLHDALPTSAILAISSPSFCSGYGAGSSTAAVGGVGGGLSGLSPSGAVLISPANDTLIFAQEPSDGIVFRPITPPVKVRAQTNQGTPIAGVLVKITLMPGMRSDSAVTAADGYATFANIRIPVRGEFTLTATATFGEMPMRPATSRKFKIVA